MKTTIQELTEGVGNVGVCICHKDNKIHIEQHKYFEIHSDQPQEQILALLRRSVKLYIHTIIDVSTLLIPLVKIEVQDLDDLHWKYSGFVKYELVVCSNTLRTVK